MRLFWFVALGIAWVLGSMWALLSGDFHSLIAYFVFGLLFMVGLAVLRSRWWRARRLAQKLRAVNQALDEADIRRKPVWTGSRWVTQDGSLWFDGTDWRPTP